MKTQPIISLSPSQQAVLSAAAQHPQGLVVSFPDALRGGARTKVLQALIQAGYLESIDDGHGLRVTPVGYGALGIKLPKPSKPHAKQPKTGAIKASVAKPAPAKAVAPRQNSKQAQVIAMLQRPQGASIEQVMQATEWQQHTVRGFFAGALKKKLGLPITSDKTEGGKRVYRIASEAASGN